MLGCAAKTNPRPTSPADVKVPQITPRQSIFNYAIVLDPKIYAGRLRKRRPPPEVQD